jgi:glycosyltransferase involved in cell wall biosynthesis
MATSLVLPCYNPPPGWELIVDAAYHSFCEKADGAVELVVVMDGAASKETNEGLAFLEQHIPGIKVVRYEENRGKGYALRQGVAVASGEIIIYTDIDMPYTMESLYTVYDGLRKNEYDVGVGVKNEQYYAQVPFVRRVISRFLRMLIRLFLSLPITDTQCGLKGFRRPVATLFQQTTIDRYLFDLEFVRNCFKGKKLRVKAIPITLKENVRFRKMDYRILLPEMLNFVKLLFK